jgi:putative ABC transport system permease protein
MKGLLYLTLKYILYHRWKTLVMIACLFLTAILPVTISGLIRSFERSIYTRSEMTPVVIGAKGSALDLTLQTLYFNRGSENVGTNTISMLEQQEVTRDGLAIAIPIHCLYEAKRFPIVGTTGDYFRFRNLKISDGVPLTILGECLLGADCAAELGLVPGDQLLSDRPKLLDLAGDYPLKMTVAGVLERSGSPDDRAVFVDLKTAWIIQGLGHGHQDLASPEQAENVVREGAEIKALPSKVVPYTEITEVPNIGGGAVSKQRTGSAVCTSGRIHQGNDGGPAAHSEVFRNQHGLDCCGHSIADGGGVIIVVKAAPRGTRYDV